MNQAHPASPVDAALERAAAIVSVALAAALFAASAHGADAKPPADPAKPATTVRVGGSPADAEFRDANQKASARYREAVKTCRTKASPERGECIRAAKSDLKAAQRAAHDAHEAKEAAGKKR